MRSKKLTKNPTIDVMLTVFYEHIRDYDIPLREQYKRSMSLTGFWEKNRRKYFKLQKRARTAKIHSLRHNLKFAYLLLQIKAICDGKEPSVETVMNYKLADLEEFIKKCITVMKNKRKTLYK